MNLVTAATIANPVFAGIGIWFAFLQGKRASRATSEQTAREQKDVRNVVLGEAERPGVLAQPSIVERFTELKSDVKAVADKVNGAAILNGKGDQLVTTVQEIRDTMLANHAATNASIESIARQVTEVSGRQVALVTSMKIDRAAWRESLQSKGIPVPTTDHLPEF